MSGEWDIGTLLHTSSGYWKGCTLQAGVRLQIFSSIGENFRSAGEIAETCDCDHQATGLLLDALCSMGLLQKAENGYSNTSFSREFLVKDSPSYMGYIILHHHHILDAWAQLDTAVATGEPVEKRSYGAEIERESFLMGMYNLAMGQAPKVAAELDLSTCRHLLDLGGGPGTYAIHFCLANPSLQATIFDRSTTAPFARKTVASFGLEERISFIGGDFAVDPIGGGPYDAAWLSHILHSNDETTCAAIIAKTVSAMQNGGKLFIHDFILDNDRTSPEFAALFSLNMLVNNGRGRSYAENEIRSMLEDAGISSIYRHPFRGANDSSILAGIA